MSKRHTDPKQDEAIRTSALMNLAYPAHVNRQMRPRLIGCEHAEVRAYSHGVIAAEAWAYCTMCEADLTGWWFDTRHTDVYTVRTTGAYMTFTRNPEPSIDKCLAYADEIAEAVKGGDR